MASCSQREVLRSSYTDEILLFRLCFYGGPLLDTTLFGGCAALFCTDYRRSSNAIQWLFGGPDTVCREYRSDCGQNFLMSTQKMKKEEECVTEMLTGGQIETSDSPWSSPVVLITKKMVVPGFVLTTAAATMLL